VGTKFNDFGQNGIFFLILASINLAIRDLYPPNVTSPLRCKPSLMVDQVPIAYDFKTFGDFFHGLPNRQTDILPNFPLYGT